MGYSLRSFTEMVELLADCPWTTAVVEQMHGSAAVVSRHNHPEYTLATMLSRSMALVVSKVLPSSTKLEKEMFKANVNNAILKITGDEAAMDVYTASLLRGGELAAWHQADFKMVRCALRGFVVEECQSQGGCWSRNAPAACRSYVKNCSKLTNQVPPLNTSMVWTKY